ncbi:Bug family tripartite tricarboxylate transporter substrate binding protein [Bordetella genomosp. 13]|uniref:MFS transporter n=1 Tax=Bordetella genomosp. 13 TaxID=463040 RepID=A0A1W6Z9J9_9BORD|nr:tripartite tricarboxylate transporter substrate binding protein [Bordetella genomosp. 13]ARP93915.1 MFS transporter [Bordetella genomosp. 13]
MRIKQYLIGLGLLAITATVPASAQNAADNWPDRPVKIVVPFQAGSATDLITRQVAQALGQEYNQSVVVEARPGAAAAIGSSAVARSPADGYTLLMSGPASMVTNRFLYKNLSYDPATFEKVAVVAITPNILLSNPNEPFKTLPEMVAYAKKNPGKLTYASFGAGTTSHLAGELLKKLAGIDIVHVPYKGAGEAIPALLSGQVSMYFDTIMTALPHVQSGKLNALAISTAQRSDMAPNIPTVAEQGYAGYDVAPWYGIVAPGGTPKPIVDKLNASINRMLKDPDFRAKLATTGAEPRGGSVADFEAMVNAEIPRTEQLIKQSGMTLQ